MRKFLMIGLILLCGAWNGCTKFNTQAVHDAYDTEMDFITRYTAYVDAQVAAGLKTQAWADAEKAILKAHADNVQALENASK